jgi:hypothetical protein
MFISWQPKREDLLDEDAVLLVAAYKGESIVKREPIFLDQDRFYEAEYNLDIDMKDKTGWRRKTDPGRLMSSEAVAKSLFNSLVSAVHRKTTGQEE